MSRRPEIAPLNAPNRPLQSAGGGGTFEGMEARIAILETHVEHIREDIGELKRNVGSLQKDVIDIKVGLATLTERVNHLPDKEFFVRSLAVTVTVLGGFMMLLISVAAFQDHIRAWFAH